MKKRLIGFLLATILISLCVGCGAESTTTEQTEMDLATTAENDSFKSAEEVYETSGQSVEQTSDSSEKTNVEVAPNTETTEKTAEATAEVLESPSEMAEPITEPEYSYTDMTATMYAQQTVNVRDLPDTNGNKLGALSTNDEITVTGQCNETGWYRINYNNSVAYVSNKYIADSKIEEIQSAGNTPSSGAKSNGVSRNASDYRSVGSLSEITFVGSGWETDFAGFVANHKNIEKVTYSHNGVTVLLYDYRMDRGFGEYVLLYDFSISSTPWCQTKISDVDSYIDNGGHYSYTYEGEVKEFHPISNCQVY